MRLLSLICAVCLTSCGPHSKNVASQLSRYHAGDDTALLVADLKLTSYPSRITPNLPIGEDHTIYFLPEGNLHVVSHLSSSGKDILTDTPFLVDDIASVADRLKSNDSSWNDYVKQKEKKP